MTGDDIGIARIGAALHPVDAVPAGRAWNLDEIEDLLPAAMAEPTWAACS